MKPRPDTLRSAALAAMVLIVGLGGARFLALGSETTAQMTTTDPIRAESAPNAGAEKHASAAEQEPTGWRVEIDVDEGNPIDTMGNAYSPTADPPEAVAGAEGDFRSFIRYLCLNAKEREMGIVAPVHLVFRDQPRTTARLVPGSIYTQPFELRTTWGEEVIVLQARAVPFQYRIYLYQDDAAGRRTGESSDTEFVRRLLESGSTPNDSLAIEMDWEEVGAVRFNYSLEGAPDAIREAGRPCGME